MGESWAKLFILDLNPLSLNFFCSSGQPLVKMSDDGYGDGVNDGYDYDGGQGYILLLLNCYDWTEHILSFNDGAFVCFFIPG